MHLPLPRSLAEEIFQATARAICDRPDETPDQRDSRTRQLVYTTLSLAPRDGLEFMLATLVSGHFSMILDAMRDAHMVEAGAARVRARAGVVALDRALISLLRDYRKERARPIASEAPRPEAQAEPDPGDAEPPNKAPEAQDPPADPVYMADFQAALMRAITEPNATGHTAPQPDSDPPLTTRPPLDYTAPPGWRA